MSESIIKAAHIWNNYPDNYLRINNSDAEIIAYFGNTIRPVIMANLARTAKTQHDYASLLWLSTFSDEEFAARILELHGLFTDMLKGIRNDSAVKLLNKIVGALR